MNESNTTEIPSEDDDISADDIMGDMLYGALDFFSKADNFLDKLRNS